MTYVTANLNGEYEPFFSLLKTIGFSDNDELYILSNIIGIGGEGFKIIAEIRRYPNIYFIHSGVEFWLSMFLGNMWEVFENKLPEWKAGFEVNSPVQYKAAFEVGYKGYLELDYKLKHSYWNYMYDSLYYDFIEVSGQWYLLTSEAIVYEIRMARPWNHKLGLIPPVDAIHISGDMGWACFAGELRCIRLEDAQVFSAPMR